MPLGFVDYRSTVLDVKTLRFWRDLFGEFSASLLLLFVANATASLVTADQSVPLLAQALNNGVAVFMYIEAIGHFSGSHMNPAVSLLFVVTKQLSILKGLCYTIVQCAGSVAGAGLVYAMLPEGGRERMRPLSLGKGIAPWQGILCEVVITYSMTLVVLGAIDSKRKVPYLANLAIGLSVSIGILAGGKITGGAMNPIIPFGPCVVTGIWTNHWIYWLGPGFGATLSALQYNLFTLVERMERRQDKSHKNGGPSNEIEFVNIKIESVPLVNHEKEEGTPASEA